MKTLTKKHICSAVLGITAAAVLCFTATSCTSITVKANSNLSADINMNLTAGNNISSILKALFGSSNLSQIASASEIRSGLEAAGLQNAEASFPTAKRLTLQGKTPASTAPENFPFVECTATSLTVTVSPQILQTMFASLPQDASYIMDLFMPPVYTGEDMDKQEYKETMAAFYGQELADELEQASVSIKLACPDGKKIKGTDLSEKTFSVPLMDLFTLKDQMSWSISY